MDYNEKKNAADYEDYILPPQMVEATKNDSRCVKLSWTPVKNAVRYQVYSSETPFDSFVKILETKDAQTEVIIDEFAGVTKYYTVCAVNYFGTVSAHSRVAEGATLAVPIITDVEASEDGGSVTLSWWMDNCNEATYQDDVFFNVYVYKTGASSVPVQTLTADSSSRTITVDGLSSMTEYEFVVEVAKKDSSAKETGFKTTAETAHRIIPDAPLEFSVTQGQSVSDIALSWVLPSGAWYKDNAGESGFVLHPLYFKIYRKEADSAADYEELYSVGAQRLVPEAWRFEAKPELFFNCTDNTAVTKQGAAADFLMVTAPAALNPEMMAPSDPYDSYIPGTVLVFKDTTAVRGKKYSYYIQSFTDDIPSGKSVTADSCRTEELNGWKIGSGIFSIISDYTKNEENPDVFERISFGYKLNFENNEISYTYVVEQTKIDLAAADENDAVKSFIQKYSSVEELNSESCVFDKPQDSVGYYRYKLYLCPADLQDIANAADCAYTDFSASGKYLVTDDATAVPVIEAFTLIEGYKDGYELSWKYNPEYSYFIHYTDVAADGSYAEEETVEVLEADNSCFEGKALGDTVVLHHRAEAGNKRIYKLEASVGLSEFARPNGDLEDKVYKTLGMPEPAFDSYYYDKIEVSWPLVQMADSGIDGYEVCAFYEDDALQENFVTDENTVLSIENGTVNCVITHPLGYDDAARSGKTINLSVIAKNSVPGDSSKTDLAVNTVGPALVNATVGSVQYDRINISWNKVNGAQGYLIRRVRYNDGRAVSLSDSADTYYFDGESLKVNSEEVKGGRASVTLVQNIYTLSDIYRENSDDESAYARNQTMVSWGIPFGYVVIPVRKNGSADDFTFDGKNVLFASDPDKQYENISQIEAIGATAGYGLGVHAEKSMNGKTQKLTWNAPYYNEETASVYYRNAGDKGSWQKVQNARFAENKISASFEPPKKSGAYEYLVAYKKEASEISETAIPLSFVNDDKGNGLSSPETDYDYVTLERLPETANKGYLLAVNYKAETGNRYENKTDYSEKILWDEWDYSQRSIGPENAVIQIRNYNLSADWISVAVLDSDLHYVSPDNALVNTIVTKDNSSNVTIFIEPADLMDGSSGNAVTAGPLQVLRDAKHYYSITLKRGDVETELGSEGNVYAFRNINDKEFAKMVMLAFSDGISKIGELSFDDGTKECKDGLGGKATAKHEKRVSDKYIYSFDNYRPKMETPAGDIYTSFKISADGNVYRHSTVSGSYPLKFDNVTITVATTDDKMPDSYKNRIVNFSLEIETKLDWFTYIFKSISGNISVNNSSITSLDTKDKCRIYVPCRLWYEEAEYYKDKTYGWWPN